MSDINELKLPKGWCWATTRELFQFVTSGSRGWAQYYSDQGALFLRMGNLDHDSISLDLSNIQRVNPPRGAEGTRTEVKGGDILISITADVGMTGLVPASLETAYINQHVALARPVGKICPAYLAWYLASASGGQKQFKELQRGATKVGLGLDDINSVRVPLAPLAEQEAIVALLDELLSDINAGVEALERALAKLNQYRAAILKAAVDGTLTADWRAQHPNVEPAFELLKRILAEQRRRWEERQLEKFKAAGKEPPKNWKAIYQEPTAPNTTDMPALPAGWCCATVDQCSSTIRYGTSAKANGDAAGVPVLRMGNIRTDGTLDVTDLKYLPTNHHEFPDLLLQDGDLLFNRTNSAELVGKTGCYRGIPSPCSFASYLIRVRVCDGLLPDIVAYSLNSGFGRRWIKTVVSQMVGQANVNGTKLASFSFPLQCLDEQSAVVEAVEDQFSVIDHLEADIKAKLKSAQTLRQSILRDAFAGKLVPQDSNDEPASELLKRIAAEREECARQAATCKRVARPAKPATANSRQSRRRAPERTVESLS